MSEFSPVKNNAASADEFLGTIKASWHKAVESVLETAQTLKRAGEELPRREFKVLRAQLQQDRVMSAPTITKLLKIASSEILTTPENIQRLPPSYAMLYELTRHDPEDVEKALDEGVLNSSTQRRDLVDVLPPRQTKQMKSVQKVERISISVRFSAPRDDVPEELLQRLEDVLNEIKVHTEVKTTGLQR